MVVLTLDIDMTKVQEAASIARTEQRLDLAGGSSKGPLKLKVTLDKRIARCSIKLQTVTRLG